MARTYKYQKIKNSVKHQSTMALVEEFNAQVELDEDLNKLFLV